MVEKDSYTQAECNLFKVKKPYQYIGHEYLSCKKEWTKDSVKIVLAFPDKYEVAISNLGQRILYDAINSNANLIAERIYAPDFDFREILKEQDLALCSFESKKNIKDFDIVGFSVQYELCYPTILEMLNLSKIPLTREERTESDPIIIAGGPCSFNPAPMSDFIDIFMIGEGEEAIVETMQLYGELRKAGTRREEIIEKLASIEGNYSPRLKNPTKKRIVQLTEKNHPTSNPIPYSSCIHDRTVIEIRRGCGRMCRFCQSGHITLPIRERKAEDIINLVKESVKSTGYDEYSLLSLSSNDYTNIESVIEELSCELNDKRVSASLPSQRIDRYSTNLANLVQGVRKSTVTLAPEAGSQRLRDVINKNLSEEQIVEAILNCYKNGSSSVKLYFILGLPTETFEDLDELAELLRKIRYKANGVKLELGLKDALKITCTTSIFVPKPFTPFQWHRQNSEQELREKIDYLLTKTKSIKGVKINYHNSFVSKLESVFARGDESLGKYVLELHKNGAYMTTWDENISYDQWKNIAEQCNISLDELATKTFDLDEELPWDKINMGISKKWFAKEYEKALSAINTIPCEFNCVACGVCKEFGIKKIVDEPYTPKTCTKGSSENREAKKYRIKLTKENELRYLSHLDWQNTLIKTLYRSGLDLCFSQGFNPTPKISLGIALPIFIESRCELIDIDIFDDLSEKELENTLIKSLPENIKLLSAKKISKDTKSIDILAQWALYEIKSLKKGLLNFEDMVYIKDSISSSDEIFIEKKSKKGIKKLVNIKPSIKSVEVEDDTLYLILKVGQNVEIPSVKADDVVKLYYPEIDFRITRAKFFDEDINEL